MVSKATAVVHGVIHGVSIPFHIDNPDACKKSGLTCPLKPKLSVTYQAVLQVKTAYPDVSN